MTGSWTGSWIGKPECSVRREHSGTGMLLSVQVAGLERSPGLLVMRRSGVRYPKAAPKAAQGGSVQDTNSVSVFSFRGQARPVHGHGEPPLSTTTGGHTE